jgi:uncharacterized protein
MRSDRHGYTKFTKQQTAWRAATVRPVHRVIAPPDDLLSKKLEKTMMPSRALPLLLLAALALPASAQEPPAPHAVLAVKGEGKFDTKPDYAQLYVNVSTRGRTLAEAAKAHEERATRALSMLQGLKGEGVDIAATSFRINQERVGRQQTPDKPAEPPQFVAATNFYLNARPINALNAIVTKLASSGLFEVQRVIFLVDQERMALNEARRDAVRDARSQAEAYADAAGVRLADIAEIADGQAIPVHEEGYADLAIPAYVQIIPPATVAFSASVKIVWRTAPR